MTAELGLLGQLFQNSFVSAELASVGHWVTKLAIAKRKIENLETIEDSCWFFGTNKIVREGRWIGRLVESLKKYPSNNNIVTTGHH